MSDVFPVTGITRSSFGTNARVLTASPTDLDPPAKSVVLLTAGDITVVPLAAGAPSLAFVGLPAGYIIPFVVRRVTALNSGASSRRFTFRGAIWGILVATPSLSCSRTTQQGRSTCSLTAPVMIA